MERIIKHPILGEIPPKRTVKFIYNGICLEDFEGEPVAVALKANGVMVHHYTSKTHEPICKHRQQGF